MPAFNDVWQGAWKGLKTDLPHPNVDLSGTTVIVTGSNGGLGKEAAAKLAAMGPSKLILAVRSVSKGEAARTDIIKANPSLSAATIDIWSLDMADFSSIKAFADRAQSELSRLDVAVLNAGIEPTVFALTKDGWESTLQVNVLGTFYLSLLLLPLLQRTGQAYYPLITPNSLAKPHLTVVSSGLHYLATLAARTQPEILPAMNVEKGYDGRNRYMDSKLMEILFITELAKRAEQAAPGATHITTVNPGFCYSGLQDAANEGKPVRRMFINTMKYIMARTTEMGARAITWGAVSSATGVYATNCVDEPPSAWTRSEEGVKTGARVWSESIAVLTKVDPSLKGGVAAIE